MGHRLAAIMPSAGREYCGRCFTGTWSTWMQRDIRRVKIYGAGSIGNHLAHAARHLGWEVTVCDIDRAALAQMRDQIYPGRYGQWDAAIRQHTLADEPVGGFDLILIGT